LLFVNEEMILRGGRGLTEKGRILAGEMCSKLKSIKLQAETSRNILG